MKKRPSPDPTFIIQSPKTNALQPAGLENLPLLGCPQCWSPTHLLMELSKGGWDPFEDITYLGAHDSEGTIFEDDIPREW